MKEIKNKAIELVKKYEERLKENGITVSISKRYFETEVAERPTNHDLIDHLFDKMYEKQEKKKKLNRLRNRYHTIILTVLPLDGKSVKKEECKQYAFLLKKVERAHIGDDPIRIECEEQRVLDRIEKRIIKLIKRSKKSDPVRLCKNNVFDVIRYIFQSKYKERDKILGVNSLIWEALLYCMFAVACVGIPLILGFIIF